MNEHECMIELFKIWEALHIDEKFTTDIALDLFDRIMKSYIIYYEL